MASDDSALQQLIRAIVEGDEVGVSMMLTDSPELARAHSKQGATRQHAREHFLAEIRHYVYAGDTPLHVAAAAYRSRMVKDLVGSGADVGARNRRGAQPLHYAADGSPGSAHWDPDRKSVV